MADVEDIFFSVVIPTRNRPGMFLQALLSVLEQDFPQKEIVVVNDGSTSDYLEEYREIESQYSAQGVRFSYLVHRPNGHGQSYSMNFGAAIADGRYLCFLDDDDYWTDPQYLSKLKLNLAASELKADIHFSNQRAYFPSGEQRDGPIWIDELVEKLADRQPNFEAAYEVDAPALLSCRGFAHLNCSAYRREFYLSFGGMDEGIRYECDRDVYLRGIDAAAMILYSPEYMSYHRIPDTKRKDNMSTLISSYEKKLYKLQVYEKGILQSSNTVVRRHCKRGKAYELKNVATIAKQAGDYKTASYYAREALGIGFNIKWLGYTLYLTIAGIFAGN